MEREEEERGDGKRTERDGEKGVKEEGREEERNQKWKKQKCGSCVLPGSFVNTLQTVFVVLPESTELSLHDSHIMWIVCVFVCVCVHICNIHI